MTRYWISCPRFTVGVTVDDDGIIREAAPLVRRFLCQPLHNLERWASRWGAVKTVNLDEFEKAISAANAESAPPDRGRNDEIETTRATAGESSCESREGHTGTAGKRDLREPAVRS